MNKKMLGADADIGDCRMSVKECLALHEAVKFKVHLDAQDSGKVIQEELDRTEATISFKYHEMCCVDMMIHSAGKLPRAGRMGGGGVRSRAPQIGSLRGIAAQVRF